MGYIKENTGIKFPEHMTFENCLKYISDNMEKSKTVAKTSIKKQKLTNREYIRRDYEETDSGDYMVPNPFYDHEGEAFDPTPMYITKEQRDRMMDWSY